MTSYFPQHLIYSGLADTTPNVDGDDTVDKVVFLKTPEIEITEYNEKSVNKVQINKDGPILVRYELSFKYNGNDDDCIRLEGFIKNNALKITDSISHGCLGGEDSASKFNLDATVYLDVLKDDEIEFGFRVSVSGDNDTSADLIDTESKIFLYALQ